MKVTPLKNAIHESGLKQQYLADKLGIPTPRFSEIVNGRSSPTPEQKREIAKLLKKRVHELFGEAAA